MPRSFAARVNWLMPRHSRQLRADESSENRRPTNPAPLAM